MKTTKEKIEVMIHYLNGGKIEVCFPGGPFRPWDTPKEPRWQWEECDYRVAVEPKTQYFLGVNNV